MGYGKFFQWTPTKHTLDRFYVEEYDAGTGGVRIIFESKENSNRRMYIWFAGIDIHFIATYEMYASPFWSRFQNHREQYVVSNGTKSPLYIVEGSDFLNDYRLSTDFFFEKSNNPLKHYYIDDPDWLIDVVSPRTPRIEIYDGDTLIEKIESIEHDSIYNIDSTPKRHDYYDEYFKQPTESEEVKEQTQASESTEPIKK